MKQLRFGDTGSHLDEKIGRYSLGPLLCEGDGTAIIKSVLAGISIKKKFFVIVFFWYMNK